MSQVLPKALTNLIDSFAALPGVGKRTAARYAYYVLRHDKSIASHLATALDDVHTAIKTCPVTFALIDESQEYSPLYTNANRDKSVVAVVAEPFDIIALEDLSVYKGTYHVLGGLISPLDGIGPEQLHIHELLQRIHKDDVKELIIATNASVEGETTALFLQDKLKDTEVVITRLARGLPIGIDLEYADQVTLKRALEGRTIV